MAGRQVLPDNVIPSHYSLSLAPNLGAHTFGGEVEIEVKVAKDTNVIVLNADKEVTVKSASMRLQSGGDSCAANVIAPREEDQTVSLTFPAAFPASDSVYILHIIFDGVLNDSMAGFYRSTYTVGSEKRTMAVTQFEPTDARRCFPCWDEPVRKATFDVTLVVPEDRVALSNMPVATEEILDGEVSNGAGGMSRRKKITYERSPIMSTYLLAFVVGEFEYLEQTASDGTLIRVYTAPGKTDRGKFGLDVAVRCLPFYKEYFGSKYPLPKLDLIAIPDFAAGAMENYGLVTYRETALLVDEEQSSASHREWVSLVVCHELAHQWFGNLVTMEWWTHLWLNEGFATFVEYLATNELFPDWEIWKNFVAADFLRALELDGLAHSHPVEVEVRKPAEIEEIFDAISYQKGCSIIRMLQNYLGEETFRKGIVTYLQKYEWSNATTQDLWAVLSQNTGIDVLSMMKGWTGKTGYPVVKVSMKTNAEGHTVLSLSQQRFLSSNTSDSVSLRDQDATTWMIPLTYISDSGDVVRQQSLFATKNAEIPLGKKVEWVKLNAGQFAFCRVLYDNDAFDAILNGPLKQNPCPLSEVDILGLVSDAVALSRGGYISLNRVLSLLWCLKENTDANVWTAILSALREIHTLLAGHDCCPALEAFIRALLEPIYSQLGWKKVPGEHHGLTKLRPLVLSMQSRCKNATVIAQARTVAEHALISGEESALEADLRAPVYAMYLKSGNGAAEFEVLLKRYRETDLQEEKMRVLRSLGAAPTPELLRKALEFCMSTEVRHQDTVFGFDAVAANLPSGPELAWNYMRENWEELDRRYGKGGFMLGRMVKSVTSNFNTDQRASEVIEFFKDHPAPAADRVIRQSVEVIRSNAEWFGRDAIHAAEWLQSFSG